MSILSKKFSKVDENYTVYMCENGFYVDVNGRDNSDEWASAKIILTTKEELHSLIDELIDFPRS